MKSLNSIRKNAIILLLMTSIILFLVLKDNLTGIIGTISQINIIYLIIAILFFLLYLALKAYPVYISIGNKNKLTFKEAIKHNIITQFFNGITPFSTGGQPMEIYMLTEHNIKLSEATSITIQNFIFYQTALVIYGAIAVFCNYVFNIFPQTPILRRLVLLGFIVNTLVALALYSVSISKKLTSSFTTNIIKLLGKIHIIKEPEKLIETSLKKLDEFHDNIKVLRKRKKLFILGILFNLLSLSCFYIIPLFIVFGFSEFTSLNVLTTLVTSAYVLIIGSFVPIPGASGGIEYGFLRFFGHFLSTTILSSVLLVWRFITYYLWMIIGAIIFSIEKKR